MKAGVGISNLEEVARETGWRLSVLAEVLHVSTRQARRLIKRWTGQAPHRWMVRIRLSEALPLMNSPLSLKEISHELGYEQYSHFSREFARVHGKPPSQFRRHLRS